MYKNQLGKWLVEIIVSLSILMCGFSAWAKEGDQFSKFEIGGGSVGGLYYVSANSFADLFNRKLGMNIPFTASATRGSGENIALLDMNRMEGATVSAGALSDGFTALFFEAPAPPDELEAIPPLRALSPYIRAAPHPKINVNKKIKSVIYASNGN